MPQSPHCLRNDLKCVEWDVKPYTTNQHNQLYCLLQYLSTPESQSLRCDLIRYICAVIHPSNEVLCSDIIPRWAVIGWLLTTCTVWEKHMQCMVKSSPLLFCRQWQFLLHCIVCRRGIAMRILSVCASVKRVNCDKTEEKLSRFLYHTKDHLA